MKSVYNPRPRKIAIILLLLLALSACRFVNPAPPAPTAPPAAPAAPAAQAARPPTVFFYGDSISTGRGFGERDYPSPLNNIHEIANLLLAANCSSGATVVSNLGQDFNLIYADAAEGKFAPGDFILWTNAGPTLNDPEMYAKWMELVLFATQDQAPLILTTTYDHGGFSDYSAPLAGGRSLNDAVRDFAAAHDVLLLDWDLLLDRAQKRTAPFGGSLLQDGIHPGPFGNFVMAVALLRYLGVDARDLGEAPRLFRQRDGDVPDLTGDVFHWGYNPSERQRMQLLQGLIADAQAVIEPGPAALDC